MASVLANDHRYVLDGSADESSRPRTGYRRRLYRALEGLEGLQDESRLVEGRRAANSSRTALGR